MITRKRDMPCTFLFFSVGKDSAGRKAALIEPVLLLNVLARCTGKRLAGVAHKKIAWAPQGTFLRCTDTGT